MSPLLLAYTVYRSAKDGGLRYLAQRLGLYPFTAKAKHDINPGNQLWVHAASVGEVITVVPLIKLWLERNPAAIVYFSTGTPTGAAVLKQQHIERVTHYYLPLDFPGACERFLNQITTEQVWIVETEIWPWLYAKCERRAISLTIINGRLSPRTSSQKRGILASSYRRALASVRILARSEEDQLRFVSLGAPAANIQVAGNLKYTSSADVAAPERIITGSYVLAASTHDDEELRLAKAWKELSLDTTLLVIVPRHPERGPAIYKRLSQEGLKVSQRSKGVLPSKTDNVYLADTLGELQSWYKYAKAAFVGGSLIPRGGHNVLEPARFACPTIVGMYTDNFKDIMSLMQASDAIAIADDEQQVAHFFSQAAMGEKSVQAMGQRAKSIALEAQNTMQRYRRLLIG